MAKLIVEMEMPSKDKVCGVIFDLCGVWFCPVKKKYCHQPDNGEIPSWCPIICQLPENHGRLVDADALKVDYLAPSSTSSTPNFYYVSKANIDYAPTIVPADAESQAPNPTDPLPIRGVEYVPTEVDVKTFTVTYELRERIENK